MATQVTLKQVLEKAVEKEIHSQRLYADLSQAVKEQSAKDAFQDLVKQEQGHQRLLGQYLRGELREGSLSHEQVIDYKIAEHLNHPEISPEMKLKDVFLLAANRENLSHEFYLALAQVHPAGRVKKLLNELAAQELEHKQRVEFLYTEVAFPQTDGG